VPALSCSSIAPDLSVPVAIEYSAPSNPSVEELDTFALVVRVLDRAGDTVRGAIVVLEVLDTAYLRVDSAGLGVIGRAPTPGGTTARVVAVSGGLRSDPLAFRVVPAADSLAGPASGVLSVLAADSQSGPLTTTVLDLTTTPGTPAPLTGRPVRYTLVYPAYADLVSARVVLSNDSLGATALTVSGAASVVVKRRGTPQPDSAVVLAGAVRGSGSAVPGSPVRFVVRFP
jgi:hypothetical protein